MTHDDYLVNHAYKHVWCAPEQDRQHVLSPRRISPVVGSRGSLTILWKTLNLPKQGPRYHVFQFGNIAQSTLGLSMDKNVWTAAAVQMPKESIIIDIYTDSGRMIPRNQAYFLITDDGNLVIAVEEALFIGDLGREEIYCRFYSNAFHDRCDMHDPNEGIEYRFASPTSTSQISALTFELNNLRSKGGYVFCYVNGWFVNDLTTATVKRGDVVEMVRDSSVILVEETPVSQLESFLSELDECKKYLLRVNGIDNERIHYRDDQEIFLVRKYSSHIYKGVFYHRNQEDAIRMVTHRDYSIPVHYVERYSSMNPDWAMPEELTVMIMVRRSGMDKELIFEANHVKDLYKFAGDQWMNAVMGSEAVVSVWRVENLEKSWYNAIMRAKVGTVTRQMVEDAYGYNTITKLVADTPQHVTGPKDWLQLPFGLRGESTIYEYDANGLLIDWHLNVNAQWYIPKNPATRYIEGIVGIGKEILSTVYGNDARIDPTLDYRCYVCPIEAGLPNGDWMDVTGDSEFYDVIDNTVMWKVNSRRLYTAVKKNDSFLTYDLYLDYDDGLYRFSLNVKELRINGFLYEGLMEIPAGQLDIWLNGHSLVEDLDWFMDGMEVCIVNKQFLNADTRRNRITVRATGFCNKDMSRVVYSEFGYVENGILSRNNRWNLRDDKVVRIVADGRLFAVDELTFDEDRVEVTLPNVRNGAPYQVVEPLIPLRGLTQTEASELKRIADEVDDEIEDYMTIKMGEVEKQEVNLIPHRHVLYSPFVAKLMHDLRLGYFEQLPIKDFYTDVEVRQWCEPYLWLLKYEPTRKGLDKRYVVVDAHDRRDPIELTVYQFNFLSRAVKIILNDEIDLTHAVTIFHTEEE